MRAAVMFPFLKWAVAHRRPIEQQLSDAGLGHVWLDDPGLLVPTLAVADFLDRFQRDEGPDIGCRVITDETLYDIGLIGRAAIGGRTLRDSMARVTAAQPYNASGAFYSLLPRRGGIILQHGVNLPLGDAVLHVTESFTAAVIALLCRQLKLPFPAFQRIDILPHPEHGVTHLAPWFDCQVLPGGRPALAIHLSDAVLDAPFPRLAAQTPPVPSPGQEGPRLHDIGMSDSTRLLVRSMFRVGVPTVERMARLAGMSVRSYQRRLADEGQTFSGILEGERRHLLSRSLGDEGLRLGDLAANLGYARQSSLTRAVRRWTGQPPQSLRGPSRKGLPA